MRGLLGLAAFVAVVASVTWLGRAPLEAPGQSPEQVAFKRAHLALVDRELSARDTSHLNADQRENRERNLAHLREYADRGLFPINTIDPRRETPILIDDHGTRCAFAYLVDRSGHDDLLARLAAKANTSYLAEIPEDPGVLAWLDEQGLSLDEVAFIQAPGLIDPGNGGLEIPDDFEPPSEGAPEPEGPTTPTRRRTATTSVPTWEQWWELNRDAFLNLRTSYHKAHAVSGAGSRNDGRRPSEADLQTRVRPFLERMAMDRDVSATALMSWARAASAKDAPRISLGILDYLKERKNPYRRLLLLGLGILEHDESTAVLVEIVKDTPRGRRTFGEQGSIADTTRAFAAVALGQTKSGSAVRTLIDVLRKEKGKAKELRMACIAGLGALADLPEFREEIETFLRAQAKRGRWTDEVLATIPYALARADSKEGLARFEKSLERFRRPREVRQGAALSIGLVGPDLNAARARILLAAARRDPDTIARRFAIVSLGELAARSSADADTTARLVQFYEDGLRGRFNQAGDMPWICLSAALFGRGFGDHAALVEKRLVALATTGAKRENRTAAVTALGLLGRTSARPALRTLFRKAKDQVLRGAAAESLGILGDRSIQKELLELCLGDTSERLRYQAARGLAFLANAKAIPQLVDALDRSGSRASRVALARAIGEIGDRSAIDGLVKIAGNAKSNVWTRRFALGALGVLAQKNDRSWVSRFKRGFNLAATTPVLRQVLVLF